MTNDEKEMNSACRGRKEHRVKRERKHFYVRNKFLLYLNDIISDNSFVLEMINE